MKKIPLVQGDNLPRVTLDLTDPDTGEAIDLSEAASAVLRFRAAGGDTVLSEIPCLIGEGSISFAFPDGVLDVEEGDYEGEVVIRFGDKVQTIYDPVPFKVRARF